MGEEEKVIEINIILDKPYVIVILLLIVLLEAGYIGYLKFFQDSGAKNTGLELEELENRFELNATKEITSNFKEPETFKELQADLIAVGVENIIYIDTVDWHGKHLELNYTDALKLAKEAVFIGLDKKIVAFIMYLNGELLIWFSS